MPLSAPDPPARDQSAGSVPSMAGRANTHPPRDRGDRVEAGPSLLVQPTEAVHPGHDGVRLSRHPNTEPPVPGLWSRQALGVGPSV